MSETSDLSIAPIAARCIASIAAFRDREAVSAALHAEFGAAPPATRGFVQAGAVTLSCIAPARYLVTAGRESAWPTRLATSLAGLAAVTDQSDQWDFVLVSGQAAADALSRLVPVDLREAAFPVGALALTRGGHLDLRVWRVSEYGYEVAVTRSCAADLHWSLRQNGMPDRATA